MSSLLDLNLNKQLYRESSTPDVNTVIKPDGSLSTTQSVGGDSSSINLGSSETISETIVSGEISGNLIMIDGFIRSKNYVSGIAGWTINADGTSQLNNLTLTGGILNYGKTSFTDSTNPGYYFSADGIYVGAASDANYLKYSIGAGTFVIKATVDGASTIGGRLASTLATAIDSSGHFVDDAINTANGTILDAFTFGASGALQIGTYVNGVSGDVKISPNGILARGTTGATTFSLNGTTGVAVLNGLVVGTNVGLGAAQDSAGVTSIVGGTVTTSFVNALNITALSMSVAGLTAGSITSKTITLAVAAGTGDVYFNAGKTDFTNTDSGFILGIDDSDSDKAKFYIGNSTNYLNWTGTSLNIKGNTDNPNDYIAGSILLASADTQRDTTHTSYTKVKEIQMNKSGNGINIYFEMCDIRTCYARIYKNGVAFGTERYLNGDTFVWTQFAENFYSSFNAGDLFQLYVYNSGTPSPEVTEIRNFRLFFGEQRYTINTN